MKPTSQVSRDTFDRLSLFIRQERSILLAMLTYAAAVGVFSLIIPLTVQELGEYLRLFGFSDYGCDHCRYYGGDFTVCGDL